MADLLPSTPDTSAVEEADPRVIGVDSDDAADLLGALSSETARELLAALHDDPANAARLARAVDTTIQNAQYHLEKLEEAGLIEVIDTVYSEKGRKMRVYAPSDRPLVVVAGSDEETGTLKTALSRLLGGFSALAVSSILIQELFGGGVGRIRDALPGPPGLPSFLAGEDLQSDEPVSDPDVTDDALESPPDDQYDVGTTEPTTGTAQESEETATATPEGTEIPEETPTPDATGTPTPEATGTPTPVDTPTPHAEPTPHGDTPTPDATPVPEETRTPTAVELDTSTQIKTPVSELTPYAAEQVATVSPGLLFFAGGATILFGAFVLWYLDWI